MKNLKLLSVIIPAYNVDAYIDACIESVLHQPGASAILEVFVVVDGATDTTLAKATHAAIGHEDFVHVIEQENAGLSAARNAGLALVRTKYVTFLDGDDVWLDDYLETILPCLAKDDVDILEYDALRITEGGQSLYRWKIAWAPTGTTQPITRDEFIGIFRCYSWARVFRTTFVRERPFPVERRYEDSATTPWYYWRSRNIVSIGASLIGYRVRARSILADPRIQDIDDIAATTREAAAMYARTKASYWQRVAHYSLQQACGRVVYQPFRTWSACLRTSRAAIAGVPPPPGYMRWFQANATPFYTCLLFLKNRTEFAFTRIAPPALIRCLFPQR